jgi:hypothetical protein
MKKTIRKIRKNMQGKGIVSQTDARRLAYYEAAAITFNRRDHPASALNIAFDYSKATPEERKAFFASRKHSS